MDMQRHDARHTCRGRWPADPSFGWFLVQEARQCACAAWGHHSYLQPCSAVSALLRQGAQTLLVACTHTAPGRSPSDAQLAGPPDSTALHAHSSQRTTIRAGTSALRVQA